MDFVRDIGFMWLVWGGNGGLREFVGGSIVFLVGSEDLVGLTTEDVDSVFLSDFGGRSLKIKLISYLILNKYKLLLTLLLNMVSFHVVSSRLRSNLLAIRLLIFG